ncbi:DUF1499 domain-containing protein [Terrilactibacillus sp. BCM23-1]|uniref:DUF1499 domain-containing protein n=1 Tax=Terrilactibacillus tamarindi TaxID=2599694 RepID=A0A6N8CN10_9BACI|nr:DUF1499 domain-containing protein [Terrilactibacillus tamarindi]MTT30940.1 DUF1499 domain-containing protein [Terrilactibacillus tamarindi]
MKENGQVDFGVNNGQLLPCSKWPNGVSTDHRDPNRRMVPLSYKEVSMDTANSYLQDVLSTIPKTTIKVNDGHYVHVEYKTPILNLPHDAEFYFDEDKKILQFRSVSRVGIADFGMNKRWLQAVYSRLLKKLTIHHINHEDGGSVG